MRNQFFRALAILLMTALSLSGCTTSNSTNVSTNITNSSTESTASNSITSSALSSAKPEPSNADKKEFGKVLIVYYSLTGNTRKVANVIKDLTGGDTFEIQPEFDYKGVKSRSEMEEIGKKQVGEGYKPQLKNSVSNIESYDLIFIGSPVWWFSVSPPVMSFLSQYDLKDKNVVPFCTCGSTYGDFFKQFENACPGTKVLKGIDFVESEAKDEMKAKEKIQTCLEEIKRGS